VDRGRGDGEGLFIQGGHLRGEVKDEGEVEVEDGGLAAATGGVIFAVVFTRLLLLLLLLPSFCAFPCVGMVVVADEGLRLPSALAGLPRTRLSKSTCTLASAASARACARGRFKRDPRLRGEGLS